jgi:RHH-type proline utilization regulon transcriptional repressor/proline dehydrogenase/delta 1-pyrroline-5-carboxylate dehydrogenase
VIRQVYATGCGLTFGTQSRIDQTIKPATAASVAGNLYVNRTIIGAAVGVQPFVCCGCSLSAPSAPFWPSTSFRAR